MRYYIFWIICLIGIIFIWLTGFKFLTKKIDESQTFSKRDIVLECEKLSAIATNDGWSYKSCIENLENPNNPKMLKI